MHIALRPYVTTGIAVVGASVIAVAPIAAPPPDLPSVETSVASTARWVTTDVELTASVVDLLAAIPQYAALILQAALQPVPLPAELKSLVVELVNAGAPAITETIKLFTETLPATALSLIAAGKFAHLGVLAANTVYMGTLTPIAPFAVVLMNALPLPFGTQGGVINQFLELVIKTPFVAGTTVLTLLAQVIDDGLSPVAAVTGAIDALSVAVTSAVESIGKILGTLGGAVPFSALAAPEDVTGARTAARVTDLPAANDTSVLAASPDSTRADVTLPVTLTVDPASPDNVADTPDSVPAAATGSDEESGGPGDEDAAEGITANGATDLSDGNMAEPATDTADDSVAASGEAPGDETAPATETGTGEDEGSGADENASGQ